MKITPNTVLHFRTAPCIDVAACGARQIGIRFSMSPKLVNCPVCHAKREHSDPRDREKFAARSRKISQAIRMQGQRQP